MTVPGQLRDRPAHRVADHDEAVDAERVGDRDRVVGRVGHAEVDADTDAATVTALVEGDHAEVAAERAEAGEPVEVGVGAQPMQEDERGRARRAGDLAHERGAPAGQFDSAARRQRRCADGHGQAPTSTMSTLSVPLGAAYSTVSPAW